MSYHRLLLATDLTVNSQKVALRARALADKNNATLDIVHVVEYSPIAYSGEFSIPVDINLEQQIEAASREALAKQADKIRVTPDRQHLLTGSIKIEVLKLAKTRSIDLIIVGTHSHSGLEALLGSRANAILHGTLCDVLAIRAEE